MPTLVLPFRRRIIFSIAERVIVILVCVSVLITGGLRCALNFTQMSCWTETSGPIPAEHPLEETPVRQDSNNSEEQPWKEEAVPGSDEFFSRHRFKPRTRDFSDAKRYLLRDRTSVLRLFLLVEYRLRNGCGANLRC